MNYRFSVKDLADLKNNFFIHKEGIPLLHTEPFFRGAKFFGVGALPQTEKIYSRLYSLPVFYRGNKRDLKSYVKELEEFLKGKKRI
jgi:dTDP-4-amino-4,6-dideoxygalactose transaminase